MAESEEKLNSLLLKVKDKSGNAGLKLNILKMKIIAFTPLTSWQIERGENESSGRFYFLGFSKITVDHDYRHKITGRLLLGRKSMTNLDRVLKSRDITLPTKVHISKLWFFHSSCMDVRVGPQRKLRVEELMLSNCGAGEDS